MASRLLETYERNDVDEEMVIISGQPDEIVVESTFKHQVNVSVVGGDGCVFSIHEQWLDKHYDRAIVGQ